MKKTSLLTLTLIAVTLMNISYSQAQTTHSGEVGFFDSSADLFIANFDSKPDPDDILSVAAVATMLRDERLSEVQFMAVAGAYGIQGGEFIPADRLFGMAFGEQWVDAHADWDQARVAVTDRSVKVLSSGGDLWIMDAGQSDFTEAVLRSVREAMPDLHTKQRVHVVQHSTWNEEQTTPEKLLYVRNYSDYTKIPDGNNEGNGTPGFNTPDGSWWKAATAHPVMGEIWKEAQRIVLEKNGKTGYKNPAIAEGGFDFSDTVEAAWIFGFIGLENTEAFFKEFLSE